MKSEVCLFSTFLTFLLLKVNTELYIFVAWIQLFTVY